MREDIQDIYPLAPMQEGILYEIVSTGNSGKYAVQYDCRIADCDVRALQAAVQSVVDRHSILRAAFVWDQLETAMQIIVARAPVPFQILDWSDADESAQEERLAEFLRVDRITQFTLDEPPLVRATFICLKPGVHHFIFTCSHLVLDGWSMSLLLDELLAAYEAIRRGRSADSRPAFQFRDFIAWLQRQAIPEPEQFWRRELDGFEIPTSLGIDFQGSLEAPAPVRYRRISFEIGTAETAILNSWCRQCQLTLSTLVHGAWAFLLSRYSGREDVLFGTVVAGRPAELPSAELMLGVFVNTLPFRLKVTGDVPVLEWLQQLQAHHLALREFSYTPLVQILRHSQAPRSEPVFNSMLVFQNFPVDRTLNVRGEATGILRASSVDEIQMPLALALGCSDSLGGILHFDATHFQQQAMERLRESFCNVLLSLSRAGRDPVQSISVLSDTEWTRLIFDCNRTDHTVADTLLDRIELAARARPNDVAVTMDGQAITYRKLNQRADTLAAHLQSSGVDPGAGVVMLLEPGVECIACLLAALKAGAVLTALDPDWPAERLAQILTIAKPTAVMTRSGLLSQLPNLSKVVLADRATGVHPSIARAEMDPDSTAFALFPFQPEPEVQRAMVSHRSVANLIAVAEERLQIYRGSRVISLSGSLEESLWGMLSALGAGATLYMPSIDANLAGDTLRQFLELHDITHALLSPHLLATLPVEGWISTPTFITYGRPGSHALLSTRSTRHRMFHVFTALEAGVWPLIGEAGSGWGSMEYKRAPNIKAYVLDRNLQPVPEGVGGWLYLGGAPITHSGIANGDFGESHHVPDSFSQDSATRRLYYTGDLARQGPRQTIEILDREQYVVIDGVLQDVARIENALLKHPGVEAAVVVQGFETEQPKLDAYVVACRGHRVETADLQPFLRSKIARRLIPARFQCVSSIPRMPDGSLNRRGLAAGSKAQSAEAPETELETMLAESWKKQLGLPSVHLDDDFFEMGGDGALASIAAAELSRDGMQLQRCDFFRARTVRNLAARLSGSDRLGQDALLSGGVVGALKGESTQVNGATLCELFEEQANRSPDAVAIVSGRDNLTYRELNEKAERLAQHLTEAGLALEQPVGIYLRRSLEMMIAVLGVMRAGGVYVPLEPSLPKERVKFMIQDAGIELVLLDSAGMASAPLRGVDVVLMDGAATDSAWLGSGAKISKANYPGPENLAYILYTSGSTGKPKGVMVKHRGLSNYLAHATAAYLGDEIKGSVVSSPLNFDATLTTLFPPLLVGKRVELLPEDENTLVRLAECLFAADGDWLFKVTPAHLEALEHVERPSGMSRARHRIVIGGEQLGTRLLRRWKRDLLPEAIFVNEYGPTETVVGCSTWTLADAAGLEQLAGSAPIGRPICNTELYVLGDNRQFVAVNTPGELYIGGEGVARGYLKADAVTAERFINHPFNDVEGARLYRSGDIVRCLPGGDLVFVGRRDDQVKIRGFRVELGEIEEQLRALPAVHSAAVVLYEALAGEKRLAAYVSPAEYPDDEEHTSLINSFRQKLATVLPEYMVPATFILLRELPLTASGKVDRKALPNPGSAAPATRPVALVNELERKIASVWSEVLHMQAVGRDDNFFDLGGHSLLVIVVCSKLGALLSRRISTTNIFEYPTVSSLAAFLGDAKTAAEPAADKARAQKELTARRRRKQERVTASL